MASRIAPESSPSTVTVTVSMGARARCQRIVESEHSRMRAAPRRLPPDRMTARRADVGVIPMYFPMSRFYGAGRFLSSLPHYLLTPLETVVSYRHQRYARAHTPIGDSDHGKHDDL